MESKSKLESFLQPNKKLNELKKCPKHLPVSTTSVFNWINGQKQSLDKYFVFVLDRVYQHSIFLYGHLVWLWLLTLYMNIYNFKLWNYCKIWLVGINGLFLLRWGVLIVIFVQTILEMTLNGQFIHICIKLYKCMYIYMILYNLVLPCLL